MGWCCGNENGGVEMLSGRKGGGKWTGGKRLRMDLGREGYCVGE